MRGERFCVDDAGVRRDDGRAQSRDMGERRGSSDLGTAPWPWVGGWFHACLATRWRPRSLIGSGRTEQGCRVGGWVGEWGGGQASSDGRQVARHRTERQGVRASEPQSVRASEPQSVRASERQSVRASPLPRRHCHVPSPHHGRRGCDSSFFLGPQIQSIRTKLEPNTRKGY